MRYILFFIVFASLLAAPAEAQQWTQDHWSSNAKVVSGWDYNAWAIQTSDAKVVTAANALLQNTAAPVGTIYEGSGYTGVLNFEVKYTHHEVTSAIIEAPAHNGYMIVGRGDAVAGTMPTLTRVFSNGTFKCHTRMPTLAGDGIPAESAIATAVTIDPHSQDYIVAGYTTIGDPATSSPFVAKVDDNCAVVWARGYWCDSSTSLSCFVNNAQLLAVTIGPDDDIVAVGAVTDTGSTGIFKLPYLMAVQLTTGAATKVREYFGFSIPADSADFTDVTVDPNTPEAVHVVGTFYNITDGDGPRDAALSATIQATGNDPLLPYGPPLAWYSISYPEPPAPGMSSGGVGRARTTGRRLAIPPAANAGGYIGINAEADCVSDGTSHPTRVWRDQVSAVVRLDNTAHTPITTRVHDQVPHRLCVDTAGSVKLTSMRWVPALPNIGSPVNDGLLVADVYGDPNSAFLPSQAIQVMRTDATASSGISYCDQPVMVQYASVEAEVEPGFADTHQWTALNWTPDALMEDYTQFPCPW